MDASGGEDEEKEESKESGKGRRADGRGKSSGKDEDEEEDEEDGGLGLRASFAPRRSGKGINRHRVGRGVGTDFDGSEDENSGLGGRGAEEGGSSSSGARPRDAVSYYDLCSLVELDEEEVSRVADVLRSHASLMRAADEGYDIRV